MFTTFPLIFIYIFVCVSLDRAVTSSFLRVKVKQNLPSSDTGVQWSELFLAGNKDGQQDQDCQ